MVSLLTIIRPIPEAMRVVDSIIRYIKTTNGCQLLVIRADTGSGKTTFLNTLPHYMKDIRFHVHTLDLEILRTD
jgi:ABC-type lipoprotein export system ATPase subunit